MRKLTAAEKIEDGFEDETETTQDGERRVIQGTRVTFSNDGVWITANEEELPENIELIAVERVAVIQKWGADQKPLETKWLAVGEKIDVDALNEATPNAEWREDINGKPVGPWQRQQVVYLLDFNTMEKYTYVTSTVGGNMCVADLLDRVKTMRRLKGVQVYAVVTPTKTFMKTRFGGRQRPAFRIMRWIVMGGGGAALPAPETPLLGGAQVVKEPSLKEEMADEIKY
jgi:hypothetical protein